MAMTSNVTCEPTTATLGNRYSLLRPDPGYPWLRDNRVFIRLEDIEHKGERALTHNELPFPDPFDRGSFDLRRWVTRKVVRTKCTQSSHARKQRQREYDAN